MEEMSTVWNSLGHFAFFERVHTNDAVLLIKLVAALCVTPIFNLIQKILHSFVFLFFELILQHLSHDFALLANALTLRFQSP